MSIVNMHGHGNKNFGQDFTHIYSGGGGWLNEVGLIEENL